MQAGLSRSPDKSKLILTPHLLKMRMMSALSLLTMVPCSLSHKMGTVYLPAGGAQVLLTSLRLSGTDLER